METILTPIQVHSDEQLVAGTLIQQLPSASSLVETAIAYAASGLSVIPLDQNKTAKVSWTKYKSEKPDEATLNSWSSLFESVGIITGKVSGVEVIDIDEKYNIDSVPLIDQYSELVGLECPDLIDRLVIQKTRNKGYHLIYRCSEISGNQKLAVRPATIQEIDKEPKAKSKTLVETRGEGGYVACYPSPGYTVVQNSLFDIPTITSEERETLLRCARSFNSYYAKENIVTGKTKGVSGQNRPGDVFNNTGSIHDLLISEDWKLEKENDQQEYWCRPGKDKGAGATFHKEKKIFYVFSSNADPFDSEKAYSMFAVYTLLRYEGDYKAASKALVGEGYGTLQESSKTSIAKVETYLYDNYKFRYNEVLGQTEFCRLEETEYKRLQDFELNSIYRELQYKDLPVNIDALHRILCSDFCSLVDPFVEYFDSLPEWDESVDYIGTLAGTLSIKNGEQEVFVESIKRWLVGQLACAKDHVANQTAIILQGSQGIGKSTWLNRLIPPSLADYKLIGTIDPDNKDTLIHLSQTMLINLDELETLRRAAIGSLKTVMSMSQIQLRMPYGRYSTIMPRRASFVGSINKSDFLEDPTGNRRFLVFEVDAVNWNTTVDMDGVYSQALSLYKSGYRSWFNQEEIAQINERNKKYMNRTHEHELLNMYYSEGVEGEVLSQWLSATEVSNKIADEKLGFFADSKSVRNIGIALTAEGYEFKMSKGAKKYYVMWDPRIRNQS